MANNTAVSLDDLLAQVLRLEEVYKPVLAEQVVEAWPTVMGELVAGLTKSVEVKDGVLIVRVNNAALKAQLFENRFELVKRLNDAVGTPVLRDCRILG